MDMQFNLVYGDEEYLIILSDFVKKEKMEVIRLPYSDEEGDWVDFEIQVFKIKEGKLLKEKVVGLSQSVKDIIGNEIQKVVSQQFIANPYFDELLIFAGNEVLTSQEKFKPIECKQCDKKNLYEKRNKENKTNYIASTVRFLEENKNPEWPFKENLLVQFSVSNTQAKLAAVDLDNLAKTIFDVFKGVVYEDDSQIISFAGDKHSVINLKAFIVAIKRLKDGERPIVQQYLYSDKMNSWQEE